MFENDVCFYSSEKTEHSLLWAFFPPFSFQKEEKQLFHSLKKPVLSVSNSIPLLCLLIKVMQTPCASKVHETLNSQSASNYSL